MCIKFMFCHSYLTSLSYFFVFHFLLCFLLTLRSKNKYTQDRLLKLFIFKFSFLDVVLKLKFMNTFSSVLLLYILLFYTRFPQFPLRRHSFHYHIINVLITARKLYKLLIYSLFIIYI